MENKLSKQAFEFLKSEQENIISTAKAEIAKLTERYIADNAEFKIGDRVLVGVEKEKGIINSSNLTYNSRIEYVVMKVKKDGTISAHKHWIWNNTLIVKDDSQPR